MIWSDTKKKLPWSDIKKKLLEAAQRVKQNRTLDATVKILLSQIPVVGPFASEYWSVIEGDDATKAEVLSSLLEMAAQQQEQFNNLSALIGEEREILLQNKASLNDIRIELSKRFGIIETKFDDLTNQVKGLTTRVDFMLQHLNVKTVSDAFATSVVLQEDRRMAEDLISDAEEVLKKAGERA